MTDSLVRLTSALADRYTIEREIGRGGMATVYLARDVKHERQVAVKVLRPELSATLGAERFLREISIAARLTHPHILALYDSGQVDSFLYYVMPYVEGESLRDRMNRERQLPIEDSIRIAREVGSALSHAHSAGVVHRDIKPENILLSAGEAVVADFGIARAVNMAGGERLTETGLAVGTPAYMSPEQASAEKVDNRSDIYSLGCVLYEMLAGQPPFTGPTVESIVRQHLSSTPPPITAMRPTAPDALVDAIAKCLAKAPADRFQLVEQFYAALSADRSTAPVVRLRTWNKRLFIPLLAAAAVAIAMVGAAVLVPRSGFEPATPPRLVVLPFVNLGAPEDDYFADGMSEEITARLARAGGISLISRTSAIRYRGTDKSLEQIGRELGVQYVLEGTIRWQKDDDGGRVRVTPQLIRISDDSHLWADIFDEPLTQIFAVQSGIAEQVVDALRVALSIAGERALNAVPTTDLQAYEAYLKGRWFFNRRTEPDLETALDYFEEAIRRDSTFALAHSGLADTHFVSFALGFRAPAAELAAGRAAAERALRLDSSLAESRASLGIVRFSLRDWSGAEREIRNAIALNPEYATAHHWYGELLLAADRPAEALAEVERARTLDPLSPIIIMDVAEKLIALGRYDEAIESCREALELNPGLALTYLTLGQAHLLSGRYADALRNYETAVELTNESSWYVGNYGYALAVAGDRNGAVAQLAKLRHPAHSRRVAAIDSAYIHIGLGNNELAINSLDQALDELSYSALFLKARWLYDGLRGEPGFQALLRKLESPVYLERY